MLATLATHVHDGKLELTIQALAQVHATVDLHMLSLDQHKLSEDMARSPNVIEVSTHALFAR